LRELRQAEGGRCRRHHCISVNDAFVMGRGPATETAARCG
jgi:hypothetical protein